MSSDAISQPGPIPVQIVFQGGGARFCTLIAVCEVLQRRHGKDIEIKRVAGSSAGAVAAVMLASKRQVSDYIKATRRVGNKYLSKMNTRPLFGMWRVLKGKSYFKDIYLENFFNELFRECPQSLSQLNFAPQIYFTNLYSLGSGVCSQEDPIPQALAKSCRCPFAFAGFRSDDDSVDGGLAMNLPVDGLKTDADSIGKVIGISFANEFVEKGKPTLLSYTQQLFNAAIQSGVDRSEAALGKGNVFSIRTDIGTFDFKRALDEGLDKYYTDVKVEFEQWLNDWVSRHKLLPAASDSGVCLIRPEIADAQWHPALVGHIDDWLKSEAPIHVELLRMFHMAELDEQGTFLGKYRFQSLMRFRIEKTTSILQFTIQISKAASFYSANLGCVVTDSAGKTLRFSNHVQEVTNDDSPNRRFRVYFLFDEPLSKDSPEQPYTLEYEYESDGPFQYLGNVPQTLTIALTQGDADECIIAAAFPLETYWERQPTQTDLALGTEESLKTLGFEKNRFVCSEVISPALLPAMMNLEVKYRERYFVVGRTAKSLKRGQMIGLVVD